MEEKKFDLEGLKNLCTIVGKGRNLLYQYNGAINKSGMTAVAKLVPGEPKTEFVLARNIIPLKKLEFIKLMGHGEPLNVADILNNVHDNWDVISHGDITDVRQVMHLILPNYDEDEFKDYHAVTVVSWYQQLINLEEQKNN